MTISSAEAPWGVGHHSRRLRNCAQYRLCRMVLDTLPSLNSRRNYAKALDDLFAFSAVRPLTRELLMEYRASLESLSASTINVRLSAIRKMVSEARKNGMLSAEDAANLTETPTSGRREPGWGTGSPKSRPGNCWPSPTARPSKASGTTSSWRSWSAVRCAGRNSPRSTSVPSNCGRADGSWLIWKGREDASGRLPSRSGSSTASTPG